MRITMLAIIALLGAAAQADPAWPGRLREYALPDYTLVTEYPREERRVATNLASFRPVMEKVLQRPFRSPGTPLYIYVVNGPVWDAYFQSVDTMVSDLLQGRFASYIVISARDASVYGSLRHEYSHYFLRTQVGGHQPLWYDEGVAALVEQTRVYGTRVMLARPSGFYLREWIPSWKLLSIDRNAPEYQKWYRGTMVDLQSWALVQRGLIQEPEFGLRIRDYLRRVNDLAHVEDAVQKSFGVTMEEFDGEMQRYILRTSFKIGALDIAPVVVPPAPQGRTLSTSESYESIARVLLDTGGGESRLRALMRAIIKADPDAAALPVLRARLAARERDDAALEEVSASLASRGDARSVRGLGIALFERVYERKPGDSLTNDRRAELEARALALLDRALVADARDDEAAWAFATLAARRHERLDEALRRLDAAKARVRDSYDLAVATTLVHEARGDLTATLAALDESARLTSSLTERAAIRQRVADLRAGARTAGTQ